MIKKFDLKKMGLEIKMHRFSCNMNQAELARLVGVSQTHFSNVECGRVSPSLRLLVALKNVFNCTLDELII